VIVRGLTVADAFHISLTYRISGDTLKVCFDPEGKKRPTQFKGASGSQTLVVHKRVKK
jgi:hypothetical protein